VVVTGDDRVSSWAASLGVPALADLGTGLSAAATVGVEWAQATRNPWLVLHSDLPLLTAADLSPLADAIARGREAIAPSSDGGTSALGGRRPIRFAYGKGSFRAHLAQMQDPLIVASLGLLHDMDTPDDLHSAVRHPRGEWLGGFYPEPGFSRPTPPQPT
jgi:2-phospho-L-lactate guanylyltransferase